MHIHDGSYIQQTLLLEDKLRKYYILLELQDKNRMYNNQIKMYEINSGSRINLNKYLIFD